MLLFCSFDLGRATKLASQGHHTDVEFLVRRISGPSRYPGGTAMQSPRIRTWICGIVAATMSLTTISSIPAASAAPTPARYPPTAAPTPPPAVVPTLTAVTPNRGPVAGNTTITLTGTGFARANKIWFGGNRGTNLKIISNTKLTVTTPAGWGTVPVRVATKDGTASPTTNQTRYRYVAAPIITKVTPTAGGAGGGTTVTIHGKNLVDVAKVLFGNKPGTRLEVISENKLVVTAPAHTAGTVNVRVITAHGISTTKGRFSYIAPPKVHGIWPKSGPATGGTKVTIIGTGFTDLVHVRFGGVPGSDLKVHSSTRLTVNTPAGKPGTIGVVVAGHYGTSTPGKNARYTYTGTTPCTSSVVVVNGIDIPSDLLRPIDPLLPPTIDGDVTWRADCGTVYHVKGVVIIGAGATLRVPAGAIVKFDPAAGLHVRDGGSLLVDGTASNPVSFTSITDDTVGGDTNKDGSQTTPAAGQWGLVHAEPGATLKAHRLNLRYGTSITGYGAAVFHVIDSTLLHHTGAPLGGIGAGRGVWWDHQGPSEIVITGNTLTSSGTISVQSRGSAEEIPDVPIRVSGNTVTGSVSEAPAYAIHDPRLRPSDLTGNTGSNNRFNAIDISGRIVEDWTMPTTGLPYVVWTPDGPDEDNLEVAEGATLTVPAGGIFKIRGILTVDGTLVTTGTAANPVIFTSVYDDEVGGDTNGDGDATLPGSDTPASPTWYLATGPNGTLNTDGLVIRYGIRW
ncbi:MAG: IPT/TIG domain-containing protein [Micropruina sp.]|uniref:IPT/TIG domain-containing protein n=1 Tax=Micropruina sp. TaxID=2737536 RepID=UPI0039E2BA66